MPRLLTTSSASGISLCLITNPRHLYNGLNIINILAGHRDELDAPFEGLDSPRRETDNATAGR